MSKVKIIRNNYSNQIEPRDLIIINGEAHLVAGIDTLNFRLISLDDGNRWDDRDFFIDMNYEEFIEYAKTDENIEEIELIKHDKYNIKLEIE